MKIEKIKIYRTRPIYGVDGYIYKIYTGQVSYENKFMCGWSVTNAYVTPSSIIWENIL